MGNFSDIVVQFVIVYFCNCFTHNITAGNVRAFMVFSDCFFLLSYCVVKAVVVVVIFVPTCMKTYFLVIACSLLVITTSCVASFTLTLASSKLHRL